MESKKEKKKYNKKIKFTMIKFNRSSECIDSIFNSLLNENAFTVADKIFSFDKYEFANEKYKDIHKFKVGRISNLRDNEVPRIVNQKKVSRDIDLQEDEFLGEDSHFLFDTDSNTLFLQRSRYSITLKELSQVLSDNYKKLYCKGLINIKEEDYFVEVTPIPAASGIEKLGKDDIKFLEFSIPNVNKVNYTDSNSLFSEIVETAIEYEAESIKVVLSVGRSKYKDKDKNILKKLNSNKLKQFKKDVKENKDNVKGSIKEQRDGAAILDLFDTVKHSMIVFEIVSRDSLPFEQVKDKLYTKYLEAR